MLFKIFIEFNLPLLDDEVKLLVTEDGPSNLSCY